MSEPPIPVVLIHGALRSRVGMLPPALYFRRRGLDVRNFGYRTRAQTLAQHARRLREMLDEWLGEPPARPVLGFFTHSMGALVVRAYLADGNAPHGVQQRVVMLSPPNQGAFLAREMGDRRVFRATYGHAVTALQQADQLPDLPTTAHALILAGGRGDDRGHNPKIPGDNDGVVGVEEMALGDVEPELVGGVHSLLQWRPAILDRAAAFLHDGPPAPT